MRTYCVNGSNSTWVCISVNQNILHYGARNALHSIYCFTVFAYISNYPLQSQNYIITTPTKVGNYHTLHPSSLHHITTTKIPHNYLAMDIWEPVFL